MNVVVGTICYAICCCFSLFRSKFITDENVAIFFFVVIITAQRWLDVVRDDRLGAAARVRIAVNALELIHVLNDFPELSISSSGPSVSDDEEKSTASSDDNTDDNVDDDDETDSISFGGNKVSKQENSHIQLEEILFYCCYCCSLITKQKQKKQLFLGAVDASLFSVNEKYHTKLSLLKNVHAYSTQTYTIFD